MQYKCHRTDDLIPEALPAFGLWKCNLEDCTPISFYGCRLSMLGHDPPSSSKYMHSGQEYLKILQYFLLKSQNESIEIFMWLDVCQQN